MALEKVNYVDNQTVITAKNMNAMQDAIIELERKVGSGEFSDGASAYEVAVANGFKGTEAEWLESLKGETPKKGTDYWTEEDQDAMVKEVLAALDSAEEASF